MHRLSASVGVGVRVHSSDIGTISGANSELAEHVNCCELKLIRFRRKNSRSGEYGTIFTEKGGLFILDAYCIE